MFTAAAALLVVLVAGQTPPPDPGDVATPPPPPATTTTPPDDKPPVVPLAPSTGTPPPAATTPVTPELPKSDAPKRVKPRVDEKYGIEAFPLGALQVAAGTGACCIGVCLGAAPCIVLSLIPVPVVGGALGGAACATIAGGAAGGTEGLVGDVFGQERAPLLWPIVAGAAPLILAVGVNGVIDGILYAQGVRAPTNPNDQQALARYQQQIGPYGYIELATYAAGTAAAVIAPVVVYNLVSVPKKPGDTGQGFPGILSPSDPKPDPAASKVVTVSMRY